MKAQQDASEMSIIRRRDAILSAPLANDSPYNEHVDDYAYNTF